MARHEELFQLLQDPAEIRALIGKTEDLHLECKAWPQSDGDAQRVLAKCLCGFANGDGGVIVVGLEARSTGKYDPDIIQKPVPVADAVVVKSRIESLVGDLVEPGLKGVRAAHVFDVLGSNSGFVVVQVPPTDGLPCRSRKDSKFYLRIASGTYPMEYFQIAEMFGRRHRPSLSLVLESRGIEIRSGRPVRLLALGVENSGRAVARYPSVRLTSGRLFKVDPLGIDGNKNFGLPLLPVESGSVAFGGGADHVIQPGTVLMITRIEQYFSRVLSTAHNGIVQAAEFADLTLSAYLAADEFPRILCAKTISTETWMAG